MGNNMNGNKACNLCAGCTPARMKELADTFPCMCCLAEQERGAKAEAVQLELFGKR
jgi:hypothetical protein